MGNWYADKTIEFKKNEFIGTNSCKKVWSSRGLVTSHNDGTNDENTLSSFSRAIDKGAIGLEIDIFFDGKINNFIVSHNRIVEKSNNELLTLEKTLHHLKDKNISIWLDLKKISELTYEEVNLSAALLAKFSDQSKFKRNHIYIESEDPFKLKIFRDIGFSTIFDTKPLANDHLLSSLVIKLYKTIFVIGDFSVLGTRYEKDNKTILTGTSKKILSNVPLFVYHVPDNLHIIKSVISEPNVRVVLNRNIFRDFYRVSNCQDHR